MIFTSTKLSFRRCSEQLETLIKTPISVKGFQEIFLIPQYVLIGRVLRHFSFQRQITYTDRASAGVPFQLLYVSQTPIYRRVTPTSVHKYLPSTIPDTQIWFHISPVLCLLLVGWEKCRSLQTVSLFYRGTTDTNSILSSPFMRLRWPPGSLFT